MYIFSRVLTAVLLAIAVSFTIVLPLVPVHAAVDLAAKSRPVYSQGLKLLRKRQFNKAIERFSIVIEQEPAGDNLQALALYHRGLAYQAMNQLDKARSDYSRAIKLQTLSKKILKVVYYNRGLVHDGLKRPNAALADFVSAIDKNPDFSPAYHNLGNVLRKMGRHKRAIKNFLKSLELGNPQPYLTYMGLALAYEGVDRNKEAITSLKYALDVRPRFKKAQDMLARLTTEDLYTFPTATGLPSNGSPTVTGSIPPGAARRDTVENTNQLNVINDINNLRLRSFVEVKKEPVQYKKLALRGSVTNAPIGRVAVIVPGPGLNAAKRGKRSAPIPRKKPAPASTKARSKFKVQLGVSKTSAQANKVWFFLRAQHEDVLGQLRPTFQRVNLGKRGVLYRIQVGPFKSRLAADRLCKTIKERAVNCFPVDTNS